MVLYLWSRDATKRGVQTWHIAVPAFVGGAQRAARAVHAGSPAATVAVITVTACAIFAALPNFWTVPAQFLTGAAAAVGIALINTFGNVAGFAAGYVTGFLKDLTGSYVAADVRRRRTDGAVRHPDGGAQPVRANRAHRPRGRDGSRYRTDRERTSPMTRLFNDPDAFADEVLEGFTAAHPDLVRRVPGGVIRATARPRPARSPS